MGCARRLVFSWGGNPGVGSLHRLRDAVEHDWPVPLEIEEHSHAGMAAAYVAGASGLPFGVLRGYAGTDLPAHNARIRAVDCPFTGERLAAVPAIRPDVTIIHAQQADARGNVRWWGLLGVQKEAALAARAVIVTVEEIVPDFDAPGIRAPHGREPVVVLPSWTVSAICVVPGGAHPSYTAGYSRRDNAFYSEWDAISRERDRFLSWMREHVLQRDESALDVTSRAGAVGV
jgi:glutaconate CoA-transferase subunit A